MAFYLLLPGKPSQVHRRPSVISRPRGQRDPLLDLWRGLALVDMAWVHLALYPIGMAALLGAWIGDYTRFAAGAFVLIAGLSVARIFGPRLVGDRAQVWDTHRRLLRRALTLVVLDRLVGLAFTLIERALSVPPTIRPEYPDAWGLLRFSEPGVTGGLLILYAVLVAATPVLDWARRRFGAAFVLAASLGLYGLAHAGVIGGHSGSWPFPVAYWQPLFVVGYLVSDRLALLRDPSGQISRWWLALVSAAFATVFLVRNGVSLQPSLATALPDLAFVKVPLGAPELTWYLVVSAFVLTWSAWLWERDGSLRRLLAWLPLLGRQSLLVYVGHLFVQLVIIEALVLLDPAPPGRALMLPLMALILVGVAAAGEHLVRAPQPRARRLSSRPALLGGAVITGCLGAILSLQLFIGTPVAWELIPTADAEPQIHLGMEEGTDIAAVDEQPQSHLVSPWSMEAEGAAYSLAPIMPESRAPETPGSEI